MIDHFRAHWFGDDAQIAASQKVLGECPGRAAGRVAAWSFARSACFLRRNSRRPLQVMAVGSATMTPHESGLLHIAERLREGCEAEARQHALWFVKGSAVDGLLARLKPVADLSPLLAAA